MSKFGSFKVGRATNQWVAQPMEPKRMTTKAITFQVMGEQGQLITKTKRQRRINWQKTVLLVN
jgi:hypothetical protein